ICLDKCNHCKHLYDLGFCFYFEAGAFLFTSSLKTKNFEEIRIALFLNQVARPFVQRETSAFFLNHFRFSVVTLPLRAVSLWYLEGGRSSFFWLGCSSRHKYCPVRIRMLYKQCLI
uniref:Uncharacterized protein n=1 Tax=Strigops habroptila TaxID=2489341 RepID=A0A672V3Q1_STRHB